jgi:hypothetical protein
MLQLRSGAGSGAGDGSSQGCAGLGDERCTHCAVFAWPALPEAVTDPLGQHCWQPSLERVSNSSKDGLRTSPP